MEENRYLIVKKFLCCSVGLAFLGVSMAMFYKSQLGSDPLSLFIQGLHITLGISAGAASYIMNIGLLFFIVFVNRNLISIGTVFAAFIPGVFLDASTAWFSILFPEPMSIWGKIIIMTAGALLYGAGLGIYISAEIGCGAVDALILWISDVANVQKQYVIMLSYFIFMILGFLLGGTVGIGTIVGVVTAGPIFNLIYSKTKTSNAVK